MTRDVFAVAQRVHITQEANVDRDMLIGAETVYHSGVIQRQLFAAAENIVVDGKVADNIQVQVGQLDIGKSAQIGGNLNYSSLEEARIDAQATISGEIDWEIPKTAEREQKSSMEYAYDKVFDLVISIIGALIVWYALLLIAPNVTRGAGEHLRKTPLKTFGIGLLVLIAVPVAAIIAMITIVGVSLGWIALALYAIGLYLTKIIAATAIGYWIAERAGWSAKHGGVWLVLLGLVVLAILTNIPYVKVITYIVMILGGLGALLIYLLNHDKKDDPTDEELADY